MYSPVRMLFDYIYLLLCFNKVYYLIILSNSYVYTMPIEDSTISSDQEYFTREIDFLPPEVQEEFIKQAAATVNLDEELSTVPDEVDVNSNTVYEGIIEYENDNENEDQQLSLSTIDFRPNQGELPTFPTGDSSFTLPTGSGTITPTTVIPINVPGRRRKIRIRIFRSGLRPISIKFRRGDNSGTASNSGTQRIIAIKIPKNGGVETVYIRLRRN